MDGLRMVTRQDIEECFLNDQLRISDLETVKPIFRDQNIKTDVNTGYSSLNELLDRFRPGELIVIHMLPSIVKTTFIMGITHTALMNGKTVAFFSLELCRRQVIAWMLCSGARAAIQKYKEKSPSDDFSKRLKNSMNALCNASLYIDDSAAITPNQLRSKCHHLKKEQGLDMIVVDYLGLMGIEESAESINTEANEKCRQLKAIAMELNVPVIVCSLLRTEDNNPPNGKLQSLALLGDDPIGKEADVVLYLHRTDLSIGTVNYNTCKIIVVKQPDGCSEPMRTN